MRKTVLHETSRETSKDEAAWLDLENLARVEVTSEDPAHPVEAALTLQHPTGWRAASPGRQTIRLLFDEPQSLRGVQLSFVEEREERHQEFALCWSLGEGEPLREIVRQQYHFSPGGATREDEDYAVNLEGVSVVELAITPHTSGGEARASLALLRLRA